MATSKRGKRSIYLPLPLPSNNDDQADTQSGWAGGRLGHHCLAGDSTGRTSQHGRESGGFSAPGRRVDATVSGERALVQPGRVNEQPANASAGGAQRAAEAARPNRAAAAGREGIG